MRRTTEGTTTDGGTATLEAPDQGELLIEIPKSALQLDIQYIPHELIFPDPQQPRVQADDELRASIAAGGIRQPITVRPAPDQLGMYTIVDGERRWQGASGVQARIPCIVRLDQEDDVERLRTQLVANTGKPLTAVEEARAIQTLYQARGGSIAELAQFLGKPVSTISQRLNLMALGPWLELVQQGLIKYTHAVEVLFAYRGCPDAVHHGVIETLQQRFGAFEDDEVAAAYDGSWFSSADHFDAAVEPLFKKSLYPIAKRKHDQHPLFNTKAHDSECACGGVELEELIGAGKRRYCGNPEWWKPLKKAAEKAEKAKRASEPAAKSGAAAGPRPKVYAPEGAKQLTAPSYQEPKGYVKLVDREGRWASVHRHNVELSFDANALTFAPADLGVHQGALYVRESAIKDARQAWQDRWARRLEELRAEFAATIAQTAEGCAVRKESAARVLAALLMVGHQEHEFYLQFEDITVAAGVTPLDLSGVHYHQVPAAVLEWTAALTPAQAAAVLVGVTVALTAGLKSPNERLLDEQGAEVERIKKLKTPYAKKPKAAKGKGKAAAEAPVTAVDDGDDDELCDEDFDEEFED